jgi:KUP system potassium uptake protein
MSHARAPHGADDAPRSLRHTRPVAAAQPPATHGVTGHTGHHHPAGAGLVLAALGIVFGDIGTSPLYALKECINGEHGVAPNHENVLGVLSLIVWSLTLVVTVKYLGFVMRADNGGEGGILALLALVPLKLRARKDRIGWIALLVLAGAALLYGDGMITPAISVLSAAEGLEQEAHGLKPYIVPLTCVILIGLFAIQSRGTEGIGRFFGPIMVVWFVTIGALGLWHIVHNPAVFWAVDPREAIHFFAEHKMHGFKVLGSVVLAVTGGEALYADMGHFGRGPIRVAWLGLVFPGLLLAYFGMGALVLANPEAGANPFFGMVPRGIPTYLLVALATLATIIASQALISGAYSLTHQAVQLGFFPRVLIKHTSKDTMGQIYVPGINWLLAAVCILLVLAFGQSSKLAAAYGIAVTGTMAITSVVYFVVTRETWGWSLAKALPLLLFFLAFDLAFFGANALKFFDGGWVPILIGAVFFSMMVVWRRGRRMLADLHAKKIRPIDEFLSAIAGKNAATYRKNKPLVLQGRTTGTAVFMASGPNGVPPTLIHHVERVRVLHEHVVLLTIVTEQVPFIEVGRRVEVEKLEQGFNRVIGRYGFMESPDVPRLLIEAKSAGLEVDLEDATYFLGRETILGLPGGRMGAIEETFFGILSRNARHAGQYFDLPPDQVVEIGVQVDL